MKRIIFAASLIISCGAAQAKMCNGQLGIACDILEIKNSHAEETINTSLVPVNDAQSGLKVTSSLNVANNVNYGFVGVLGAPSVNGLSVAPIQEMTGVQGTVFKNSASANVTGLRCSVYDFIAGGTSTCLSVEFPYSQAGTNTTGVVLSAGPYNQPNSITGVAVTGNKAAFKVGVDMGGTRLAMGSKDGILYCFKFNPVTAGVDYVKYCGETNEAVVGGLIGIAGVVAPPVVTPVVQDDVPAGPQVANGNTLSEEILRRKGLR